MTRLATASRRSLLKAGLAGAAMLSGLRPAAAADPLAAIRARGELVCATEMAFPPFDFLVDQTFTGVDRDLIDQIGIALDVKVTCLDMPWTGLLSGLEARKFDLVIAPVPLTAERLTRYAFTVPIADATVALLKRANDASIAKPADIAGKVVGGLRGTPQIAQLAAYARTLPRPVQVREYADDAQPYAELAEGRIDAVANALPNLGYRSRQSDTFAIVRPPFGRPAFYAWAGRLDEQPLVDAVSAALLKMQDDCRLAAIQQKWFGQAMALPRTVPDPSV
jgi:polar amino acid transport system substrate-binding protein